MKSRCIISVIIIWVLIVFVSCGSTKVLKQPHDLGSSIVFVSAIGVNQSMSVGGSPLSIIPNKYGFEVYAKNPEVEFTDAHWKKMAELDMRVSEIEAFREIAFFHHIILKKF